MSNVNHPEFSIERPLLPAVAEYFERLSGCPGFCVRGRDATS